jgi:hypothetical protein
MGDEMEDVIARQAASLAAFEYATLDPIIDAFDKAYSELKEIGPDARRLMLPLCKAQESLRRRFLVAAAAVARNVKAIKGTE